MGPSDPDAMFFLGRTYLELGQYEKAADILGKLLEKYPDFTEVSYFLGTAQGKQGDMENAHFNLGVFSARRGKLKSAAFHLERAQELTTDPERKATIEKLLEGINKRLEQASKRTQ
jgi:predicted Zn-dependent protease